MCLLISRNGQGIIVVCYGYGGLDVTLVQSGFF